jgi:hypothetical protein
MAIDVARLKIEKDIDDGKYLNGGIFNIPKDFQFYQMVYRED